MMQFIRWQLAAFFALALAAHAQTSRGTVTGTVLDTSGGVIAGAHVTLTGIETGASRSTDTNGAGIYRFDAVDLGLHDLKFTFPGFRPFFKSGMSVEANRVTTFDPRLELGSSQTTIEVSGESSEILIKDSPLRGGNFQPREVRDLPLISMEPISLARTLPGVTQASGSFLWTSSQGGDLQRGTEFAVNGQRVRANNYLLDGTENNDMAFTGVAQPFNIVDAVQEVSVQTGHFGVEFGRAGGGIFNVVTKSGTNDLHGTLLWRYQSQRFNSVSNLDKLNGIPKSVFSNNVGGFTVGGPVRKNKDFFFGAFQQTNRHSTGNVPLVVPTADAASRLRTLFPSNPRLDLYLATLGELRGSGAPFPLQLGADPQTGLDRGSVQFATASYVRPSINDGPQWLVRLDHYHSEAHRLSWRYISDSRTNSPSDLRNGVFFPGFIQEDFFRAQNFLFADSYTIGPSYTNEFRFSYGRPRADYYNTSPDSVPLARTLPRILISNISSPGLPSGNTQFHYGNNFLFQETQTKLSGRHAFRYGVEFLRQLATQARGVNELGTIPYRDSVGYSAFANFLDDFSGPSAPASKTFGANAFHPNQFRQSYFFQDNWKATPSLALTVGLRYENFGQPANSVSYPAFAGFDPAQFLVRHEVNRDDNNFGPSFGVAWSPARPSGWFGKLFGDSKTVWRGGYQVSYDTFFTQMISLGLAGTTPNAISTQTIALNSGRGSPNWFAQLPSVSDVPRLLDNQTTLDKDLRSPYTERWSFGFQRHLPGNTLLDVSYVGSESHKLTTKADFNTRQLNGQRLYSGFGPRVVRTSQGNSAYHALQWRLDRRFARGFEATASYTWSRMIDSASEGVGNGNLQETGQNLTSIPVSQGGLKLDRSLSDYDRTHRFTIQYLWTVPGPRTGWWKSALGGWAIALISTFQSGTPFTVGNGSDRNNDGIVADRPDISNPNAPLYSRAVIFPRCATGYQNPDSGACVSPADVHWIEGTGLPNPSTAGRNTLLTGSTNDFDMSLSKSLPMGEKRRLEFRWEAQNALNHPQFIQVPSKSVTGTVPGRFLNRDFTDSGIRTMWAQVKLIF